MLNINMECFRAYVQDFKLYFHVFHRFMLNTIVSTHVLQSLSLNTKHLTDHVFKGSHPTQTFHESCASGSTPNKNIWSIMCFRVHTQHKHFINHVLQGPRPTQPSYISICIIKNCLTPNIQNKSSCSYAVGFLAQYKIKHQYNHHD